jgi:hypothetical protein
MPPRLETIAPTVTGELSCSSAATPPSVCPKKERTETFGGGGGFWFSRWTRVQELDGTRADPKRLKDIQRTGSCCALTFDVWQVVGAQFIEVTVDSKKIQEIVLG